MRRLLRRGGTAMLLLGLHFVRPTDTLAQTVGPPAAPEPQARRAARPLSQQDSLAIAKAQAAYDSARRGHRRMRDSVLRANPPGPGGHRATRRRSRASGGDALFGYGWVFYADVVAGAFIGFAALLFRQRYSSATLRRWWAVAGSILGAIGGGFVFLVCFIGAGLASVLAFFGEPTSPRTLFAVTLAVMLLFGAGAASDRPR